MKLKIKNWKEPASGQVHQDLINPIQSGPDCENRDVVK